MPLTGPEKNAIAQIGVVGAGQALAPSLPPVALGSTFATATSLGPALLPLLTFIPPALGLLSLFGRQRFPVGGTEQELFGPIRELERTGRRGRISSNPFTGRPVISAFDQDPHLFSLLERRARTEAIAPLLPEFSRQLGLERTALIEGLAETAVERGFFGSTAEIEDLRGGVFRRTAESPLEFVPR